MEKRTYSVLRLGIVQHLRSCHTTVTRYLNLQDLRNPCNERIFTGSMKLARSYHLILLSIRRKEWYRAGGQSLSGPSLPCFSTPANFPDYEASLLFCFVLFLALSGKSGRVVFPAQVTNCPLALNLPYSQHSSSKRPLFALFPACPVNSLFLHPPSMTTEATPFLVCLLILVLS